MLSGTNSVVAVAYDSGSGIIGKVEVYSSGSVTVLEDRMGGGRINGDVKDRDESEAAVTVLTDIFTCTLISITELGWRGTLVMSTFEMSCGSLDLARFCCSVGVAKVDFNGIA